MDILYLLIPIAILFLVLILVGLFWAIRSGQFDDLEGPAHEVLLDDDGIRPIDSEEKSNTDKTGDQQ